MSVQSTTAVLPAAQRAKPEETLSRQDYLQSKSKDNFSLWLREASQQTGLRPMRIFRDYFSVRKAPGRLTLQDYFLYRLYDNDALTLDEKRRFISNRLHWPVTRKCCDMSWQATTEDKWLGYTLLQRFGFAVPETVAIVDAGQRNYADTAKISSAAEFKSFLSSRRSFPLFCKPNRALGSFGAFVITGIDGDMVRRERAEPIAVEELFAAIVADRPYLVQEPLTNHAAIRAMTPAVATIRTVNIVAKDSIRTPFAAFKLPAAGNFADNYWRKGNLLANIDVGDGSVKRVIRGTGVATEVIDAHPDSGHQFAGMRLPFWKEAMELNEAVVSYFPSVRYNSLDIAITDDGPVVVEINTGGSFELPQLASGKGLLTDEVEAFFRSCDAPLGK
jgi:hypothetical protein